MVLVTAYETAIRGIDDINDGVLIYKKSYSWKLPTIDEPTQTQNLSQRCSKQGFLVYKEYKCKNRKDKCSLKMRPNLINPGYGSLRVHYMGCVRGWRIEWLLVVW